MNKTQISTCNSGVQICRGSFNTFDTLSSCPFFWQVDGKNRQWRFNSCCNSRWWHTTAGDLPHTCQTWPISFSFSTSGFSINKFDCKITTSRLKTHQFINWVCIFVGILSFRKVKSKTIWNNSHSTNSGLPFSYMSGLLFIFLHILIDWITHPHPPPKTRSHTQTHTHKNIYRDKNTQFIRLQWEMLPFGQ